MPGVWAAHGRARFAVGSLGGGRLGSGRAGWPVPVPVPGIGKTSSGIEVSVGYFRGIGRGGLRGRLRHGPDQPFEAVSGDRS